MKVVTAFCAYRRMAQLAESRRARVEALLRHFHQSSALAGLELIASPSPIQAVMVPGGNARVIACAHRLRELGCVLEERWKGDKTDSLTY